MNTVAIVDYGLCNLDSIARAVDECGGRAIVTDDPKVLASAARVIVPGVGAFGDAMANVRANRLDVALRDEVAARGVPLLGICLGMQLLATTGFEGGRFEGLGLIRGEVRKLEGSPSERVPHIGWNEVAIPTKHPLFDGISDRTDFYFVHSFHVRCEDAADVVTTTPYCGSFVSSFARGNVFGVQFHPEKSQVAGFRLLKNFLAI